MLLAMSLVGPTLVQVVIIYRGRFQINSILYSLQDTYIVTTGSTYNNCRHVG